MTRWRRSKGLHHSVISQLYSYQARATVYGTLFLAGPSFHLLRAQSSTLQKYPNKLTRCCPAPHKNAIPDPGLEREDICFCFRDGFVKQDVAGEKDQRQPGLGLVWPSAFVHRGTVKETTLMRREKDRFQSRSILVIGCIGVNHVDTSR